MNEQAVLYTHTKAFYRALKAQDFDSLLNLCANVFSRCSMKMRTLVDSRQLALRGTVDSQLADHLHEVVDFSVHGRLADVQVLLHGGLAADYPPKYAFSSSIWRRHSRR